MRKKLSPKQQIIFDHLNKVISIYVAYTPQGQYLGPIGKEVMQAFIKQFTNL